MYPKKLKKTQLKLKVNFRLVSDRIGCRGTPFLLKSCRCHLKQFSENLDWNISTQFDNLKFSTKQFDVLEKSHLTNILMNLLTAEFIETHSIGEWFGT